jgi:hypothetical protein
MFSNAYIERGEKESEQTISQEDAAFLNHSIDYLKTHKKEFLYLESQSLDQIRVDAISLEADDVFGTYDVMLGLKLQKKYEKAIKTYLQDSLKGDGPKFDLIFNSQEGLWDVNFALNFVEGFEENIPLREAYQLIYDFLFRLVETVKEIG